MLEMGAKAHQIQRLRRGGFKCEFCGRLLKSLESLRSHESILHSSALKQKRRILKPKRLQTSVVGKGRTVSVVPAKSKVPQVLVEAPANNNMSDGHKPQPTVVSAPDESTNLPKVVFKCSTCDMSFTSNFSLQRHNKKICASTHMPKSSEDAIQAILDDFCSDDGKSDTVETGDPSNAYLCVGCKQTFLTMKMFDQHVPSLHCEGVESMFFPTKEEYSNWRTEMESFTKTSYGLVDNYNTKQIYRCSHQYQADQNSPHKALMTFCPSTVISQEFPKGIQVHYYKQHSGHSYRDYILSDKYKSYSITGLLQQASSYNSIPEVKDEDDLYVQFKTLMESIIIDAAKINIATLKVLIGKALDMTSVLTNYDEDGDETVLPPKLTLSSDNSTDISSTLKAMKKAQKSKRDVTISVQPPEKMLKPNALKSQQQIKVLNTFSLANEKDTEKILKELDGEKVETRSQRKQETESVKQQKEGVENTTELKQNLENVSAPIDSPIVPKIQTEQSPSSFNDSYKSFVDKNFVLRPPPKRNPPEMARVKKHVMKTKIGQFKPSLSPKNTSVSPKNTAVSNKNTAVSNKNTSVSNKNTAVSIKNTPVSNKNAAVSIRNTPLSNKNTPVSQKNIVTSPIRTNVTARSKSLAKTTPRRARNSSRTDTINFAKVKEIEYEVKERENDCNILILKI